MSPLSTHLLGQTRVILNSSFSLTPIFSSPNPLIPTSIYISNPSPLSHHCHSPSLRCHDLFCLLLMHKYTNIKYTKQPGWSFKIIHQIISPSGTNHLNGFSALLRHHRSFPGPTQHALTLPSTSPASSTALLAPTLLSHHAPNQYTETLMSWNALCHWGISKASFVFPLFEVESLSRKWEPSVLLWMSKSAKNNSNVLHKLKIWQLWHHFSPVISAWVTVQGSG